MLRLIYLTVLLTTTFGDIVEDDTTAIINGDAANIEDFPYYAFLEHDGGLYCGGSFIERDVVLTAAHCLGGATLKVFPGITKVRDLKRAKGYTVKAEKIHPKYLETYESAYDVGLLKLDKKIKLGNKAQLIKLATEAPPVGEEANVVGFGIMKCKGEYRCHESAKESKRLRTASMVISSIESDGEVRTIPEDNKNTCYGDSGGPIAYDGKVIGVVSSGEIGDCSGYDIQGPIFTHLDWIKQTIKDW